MSLFYAPDISIDECILPESEATHALRVLRLTEGDDLLVTDGNGNRYKGILETTDIKNCKIKVIKQLTSSPTRGYGLHIAIAPTKNNNRFEWFLEKSCEIGVDTITPIICDHSERRKLQSSRLQKILIGAMKQSGQDILPALNPIVDLDAFMTESELEASNTFMASFSKNNRELIELINPGTNSLVLIGPEGDFSMREKEQAKKRGITLVNLGNTRLRTETAGIVAAHSAAVANYHAEK